MESKATPNQQSSSVVGAEESPFERRKEISSRGALDFEAMTCGGGGVDGGSWQLDVEVRGEERVSWWMR